MLDVVVNMFTRRDPRRSAALAVARIMSRYEMVRLSFEEGIRDDRRASDERNVALGVWLFPCRPADTAADIHFSAGVPAITHGVRPEGFSILTPVRLRQPCFVVAIEDEEEHGWRFFRCQVRHNTRKTGGWFQLGLQVDRVIQLEGPQWAAFRHHVNTIKADSDCE